VGRSVSVSYLVANVFEPPCIVCKTKDGQKKNTIICWCYFTYCESAVVPIRKLAHSQWRYCDVTKYFSVVFRTVTSID